MTLPDNFEDMKSVAINVGANGSSPGGRGPMYEDGSFRYVPITEAEEHDVSEPTYRELDLDDVRPASAHDTIAHFDPEFPDFDYGENYTYGDRHPVKTRYLNQLEKGDYLFFYGTFDFKGPRPEEYWINPGWGGYVFGHFALKEDPITIDEYRGLPEEKQKLLRNNAHLRRKTQDDDLIFLIGDEDDSCLYDEPIPLSLPTDGLSGNEKSSYFLSRDDVNIRSGFWYRGPLELGPEATEILLTARSENDFTSIFGPLLEEQPGFDDFVDNLYPPDDFSELRQFLHDYTDTPEEETLATFSYIAGGFAIEIPHAIISEDGLGASTIFEAANDEDLRDVLTSVIEELRAAETRWYDGHRKNIATRAGQLRADGDGLEPYQAEVIVRALTSCADLVEPSFYEFLQSFSGEDSFAQALDSLKKVDTFARLGAFDLLEALVQANEYEWLAPYRLRYSYVNNVGPKRGLEHVFGIDDVDNIEKHRREGMLTQLLAYTCDREGFATEDAVFAVESALCNCQK